MKDSWRQACTHCAWSLADKFEWKDLQNHTLSMRFIKSGTIGPEGTPEGFNILVEDDTARTHSTWSILEYKQHKYEPQRRIYEPFQALGASLQLLELDKWCIWELAIDPTTNGDPPEGRFWIVQHRDSPLLIVRGATSYGLLGFQASSSQLELRSIGEKASLGSIEILSWVITLKGRHLSGHISPPTWLFLLGGTQLPIVASTSEIADHNGIRFFSQPILKVTQGGGEAGPSEDTPQILSLTYLNDWSLQIPHYSTDGWAELGWAWTSEWNVGPKRAMVAPSHSSTRFIWAGQVRVFYPKLSHPSDLPSLTPIESSKIAALPGWRVVLVQRPNGHAEAVGLVPPNY